MVPDGRGKNDGKKLDQWVNGTALVKRGEVEVDREDLGSGGRAVIVDSRR